MLSTVGDLELLEVLLLSKKALIAYDDLPAGFDVDRTKLLESEKKILQDILALDILVEQKRSEIFKLAAERQRSKDLLFVSLWNRKAGRFR